MGGSVLQDNEGRDLVSTQIQLDLSDKDGW